MNIFGSASPWERSPFSDKKSLGQRGMADGYDLSLGERETLPVNGGHLERAFGFLWFFPDQETSDKIEAHTGEKPSESIEARIVWCNPTPPILPTLGGFTNPDTGEYCEIEVPEEWKCATYAPWLCKHGSGEGQFDPTGLPYDVWWEMLGRDAGLPYDPPPPSDQPKAVQWDEDLLEYVPYDPVGTPPYWGEWGVKDGECGKVGPFDTIDEAFRAAGDAAGEHGATELPTNGWAQVKDSKGTGVGPIT